MRSVESNWRIIKVNNLTVALEALQPSVPFSETIRQPWALSSDIQAARRGLFTKYRRVSQSPVTELLNLEYRWFRFKCFLAMMREELCESYEGFLSIGCVGSLWPVFRLIYCSC